MRAREIVFLVIGLSALALLARTFGLADVAAALRQVTPGYFAIYAALVGLALLGHSVRWRLVARTLGATLPLGRLFQARLAGDAVGSIIPSAKMAGEPVRFALADPAGDDGPRTVAGLTIDRLLEATANLLCVLAYVGVLTWAPLPAVPPEATRFLAITALVLLLAVASLFELTRRGIRPLAPLYGATVRRRFPRVAQRMAAVQRAEDHLVAFLRDHRRAFLRGLALSLGIQGIVVLHYHFLLTSFGIDVGLPTLLMVILTGGLARSAPTPAGLGALETGQVALFQLTAGRGDVGFVVGMVMRLHETVWTGFGLVILSARGLSLSRLRGSAES